MTKDEAIEIARQLLASGGDPLVWECYAAIVMSDEEMSRWRSGEDSLLEGFSKQVWQIGFSATIPEEPGSIFKDTEITTLVFVDMLTKRATVFARL